MADTGAREEWLRFFRDQTCGGDSPRSGEAVPLRAAHCRLGGVADRDVQRLGLRTDTISPRFSGES